ncbi:MAG: hypothetical protein KC635_00980 [Myxococcales bacterium]|nr:hypothetical protein [Myxococcales bacterium]
MVAIALAIGTRQVYLSLFLGIACGTTILAGGDPLAGLAAALEACVHVFADAGNTRVVLFSAMIGALIVFTQHSGGVAGFVDWISQRRLVTTPRRARVMAWSIGVVVFVESSITSLVTGAVCRPLFDRLGVSREKLAYLCDATAAPVCILIPLNAWGATVTGLLANEGVDDPVSALVSSMPWNFYPLLTLVFAFVVVAWMGRDFGPMRRAEQRVRETGELLSRGAEPVIAAEVSEIAPAEGAPRRARTFLVPVLVMVAMMPIGLALTATPTSPYGSGSTAVLWAVVAGTVVAALMSAMQRTIGLKQATDLFFKGTGGLMPLAVLMVLAFAIGDVTKALGTGKFVAHLAAGGLPAALAPALLFLVACGIAFATGTSWGTFAIMLPIGVPMAAALGIPVPLAVGAVLGGGVFGDHCSPISDTTIIASLAAGTDHIDHVRTQLPYALTVAAVSVVGYLVAGVAIAG